MSKDTRGKIAPEDNTLWKCPWLNCVFGSGLAGSGICSAEGEWDSTACPKFCKVPDHMKDKPEKIKPIDKYLIRLVSDSGTTKFTTILDAQDVRLLKHLSKVAKVHASKGTPILEIKPWA